MRIQTKLLLPIIISFVIFSAIISVLNYSYQKSNKSNIEFLKKYERIKLITTKLISLEGKLRSNMLSYRFNNSAIYLNRSHYQNQEINNLLDELKKSTNKIADLKQLRYYIKNRSEFNKIYQDLLNSINARQNDYIKNNFTRWVIKSDSINAIQLDLTAHITHLMYKQLQDNTEQNKQLFNLILFISSIIILIVFSIVLYYIKKIITPINDLTKQARKLTQGVIKTFDFKTRNDEIGELDLALSKMTNKFIFANNQLKLRITESAHSLQNEKRYLNQIMLDMLDGLLILDESGKITSINYTAEMIFKYDKKEVIGKNPYDILLEHNSINPISIGSITESIGIRSNGIKFPIEITVSPISIDNQKNELWMIRDITERFEVEKLKNDFISTVSHELRTPLTSIIGSLKLAANGVLGNVNTNIQQVLEIAISNSDRLLSIINDLLDIQKINSGEEEKDFKSINIIPLLQDSIKQNEPYAREFAIHLNFESKYDHLYIDGNEYRLQQVMSNLISNAVKFSKEESTVSITVETNDKNIQVNVTNFGVGIPDDFRNKIFGKFAQADSADNRRVAGTGLGLNLCKLLIQNHNGEIGFDSIVNDRTTFYFTLPIFTKQKEMHSETV